VLLLLQQELTSDHAVCLNQLEQQPARGCTVLLAHGCFLQLLGGAPFPSMHRQLCNRSVQLLTSTLQPTQQLISFKHLQGNTQAEHN
jgi:hypothetical protein